MSLPNSNDTTYELNHELIITTLQHFLIEQERLPSKAELAEKTGLNRHTVDKHLKDLSLQPLDNDKQEMAEALTESVMAHVIRFALSGNIKAARLYFDIIKHKKSSD